MIVYPSNSSNLFVSFKEKKVKKARKRKKAYVLSPLNSYEYFLKSFLFPG